MRTIAEEMLSRINAEIKLLNYDNDITADDALHMVKFITPLYSQLRKLVSDYVFPTNEDEILFFKEIEPNILYMDKNEKKSQTKENIFLIIR